MSIKLEVGIIPNNSDGRVVPAIELTNDLKDLINLMRDYNLTWACVYNIIKEAIDDLEE